MARKVKQTKNCFKCTQQFLIERTDTDQVFSRVYEILAEEVQAKKSTRRMPWHQEPKKDVTSCDKLRGAANKP